MGNSFSTHLPNYNPNDYKNDKDLDLNPANYPNFGNYTLKRMPLKDLITLPLEEQMQFSDAICRRYALNPIFKTQQMQYWDMFKYGSSHSDLNETSVGNMAFMKYCNPNDSFYVKMYDETIEIIQNGRLIRAAQAPRQPDIWPA
jgi:hypothetical protein